MAQEFTIEKATVTEYFADPPVTPTEPQGYGNQNASGREESGERDPRMRGKEKWRELEQMVYNSSAIAAFLHKREKAIKRAKWTFKANKNFPAQSEAIAKQCEQIFDDMASTWADTVVQMANFELYGYQLLEWVLKPGGSEYRFGFEDIYSLPHESVVEWAVDDRGKPIGIYQEKPKTRERIPIPIEKLFYLRRGSYTYNPSGLGLLRQCFKDWDTLSKLLNIEAIGFDNNLRGIPVIKAPQILLQAMVKAGKLTQDDADKLIQPLRNFAKNHANAASNGLLVDSGHHTDESADKRVSGAPLFGIDLLTGDGAGLEELGRAIVRYQFAIARVFGCEYMLIGEGASGSHALHQDKSREFHDAIDGTLADIAAFVRRHVIKVLALFNDWPREYWPEILVEASRQTPLDIVSDVLRTLADSGINLLAAEDAIAEVFARIGLTAPDMNQFQARQFAPTTSTEDIPAVTEEELLEA